MVVSIGDAVDRELAMRLDVRMGVALGIAAMRNIEVGKTIWCGPELNPPAFL